jgi:hypothetical protein
VNLGVVKWLGGKGIWRNENEDDGAKSKYFNQWPERGSTPNRSISFSAFVTKKSLPVETRRLSILYKQGINPFSALS